MDATSSSEMAAPSNSPSNIPIKTGPISIRQVEPAGRKTEPN
jgi:hypothetical protein